MAKPPGKRVPAASIKSIRNTATVVRNVLKLGNGPVDMISVIEHTLPERYPGFMYEILDSTEMTFDEARTFPDRKLIQIREDVYYQATDPCASNRPQFTLAHELGHLVLHAGLKRELDYYPRNKFTSDHKVYEDSEWQADTFAAEFLMPYDQVITMVSPEEIESTYKVTEAAAKRRWKKVKC